MKPSLPKIKFPKLPIPKIPVDKLKEKLGPVYEARLKPSVDQFMSFYSARSDREKIMVIALGVAAALFLDYWILVRPVAAIYAETLPKLQRLNAEKKELVSDWKNQDRIQERWTKTTLEVQAKEKRFVATNELPSLLENLSRLARESGVKILALRPIESQEQASGGRYQPAHVKISATAGAHELGSFLSKLENAQTFFAVKNLVIRSNTSDLKKHLIEVELLVYRRTG